MNILDAIIIIILVIGILAGVRRGFVKQAVLLIGLFLVLTASFYLKNPVATFFYKHLPFFKFGGIFKGVSVINILVYEVVAFLIVFSVLYLVLRILLKVSGLIESLLKATIVLGFFSKIAGGIVGFIESYIIVFILLFIANQPFVRVTGIEESYLAELILDKTPIMSSEENIEYLREKGKIPKKNENKQEEINQYEESKEEEIYN